MRKYLTPNSADISGIVWRSFFVPGGLLKYVSGAVQELCHSYNWENFGDITPEEIAVIFTEILGEPLDNPLTGTVITYITELPPIGVLPLDGSTYAVADYAKLAALLPPSLISGENFSLPDARGTFIRVANGDNLGTGGQDEVVLTIDQIPAHSHEYTPPVANIDIEAPGVPDVLAAGIGVPMQTSVVGGGQSHTNVPSFLSLNYGVVHGE